jgi:hypothetical protein
LKGNSFSIYTKGIEPRFVDTNLLATGNIALPASLGLRPQAMTVKFMSPDMAGTFLNVHRHASSLVKDFESLAGAAGPGRPYFYKAFIGETISLIYSPAYVEKGSLYDAFTKKRLLPWPPEAETLPLDDAKPPNWQVRFLSTLCPKCGWDLEGEKDAFIMICRKCDSTWHCPKNAFEAVPFSVMPATVKEPVIYLPFWRMKPRCEGVPLSSLADLIRLANLPRVVRPADESKPVHFWSPAFKVNPALFLRLAGQMTTIQPDAETHDSFDNIDLYRVTLSMAEAVESMMITLAQMTVYKRRLYPELAKIELAAEAVRLVYHPFKIGPREFIHTTAPIAIDRQALNLAMHL